MGSLLRNRRFPSSALAWPAVGGWGKQCQGSQLGRAARGWAAGAAALHQKPEVPKEEEDGGDDNHTPTYNLTVP